MSALMRYIFNLTCALCVAVALGLGATPAAAQAGDESSEAENHARGRELAGEGLQAYQDGDFERARTLFTQARELYPSGQVLRMLGYSTLVLDRWLETADALEAALNTELKPLAEDDRPEVEENLQQALSHIGTVTVESTVDDATVAIDGGEPELLPLGRTRLIEGTHRFVVSAEGHEDVEQSVELDGGDHLDLEIDPIPIEEEPEEPPEPPPPPAEPEPEDSPWPLIGVASGAVGLTMMGMGIGTLIEGVALRDHAQDRVSEHNARYGAGCARGDYDACVYDAAVINRQGDRAEAVQGVGLGLTIGGAVLATVGVLAVVLAPDDSSDEDEDQDEAASDDELATWSCGPHGLAGLGCSGRF